VRVLRTESAESDLDAIADYFGQLNPQATLHMLDRIFEVEATLNDYPYVGKTGRVKGTREAVVTGTPFILVYMLEPQALTVLRILHGRQKWPEN
jgi:addiction module RelE/StbE family toxin